MTTTDVHAELEAERAHLAASRAALARMRERAAQIGDYAVDALASEALGKARAARLEALVDDGTTPLFFGRLDVAETAETFHVGRRHVLDVDGDPMVVDWRAPVALPFYRATAATPMGVERRRRFGFHLLHRRGAARPRRGRRHAADGRRAGGPLPR